MKYLKLFENKEYYKIERIDMTNGIEFSKYEIDKIYPILKEYDFSLNYLSSDNIIVFNHDDLSKIIIRIKKSDDDFYYIKIWIDKRNKSSKPNRYQIITFYKCDQFYGLKKCLKNEIPKII